ncbi:MAG TPA: sugar phosphate nucleotidyltransferase [Methylomirabilota bacterium]|jgi:mannose-1-phosphate guanylyltransferase|nr:sugar phosphate nucleotidyltransferase [Methylomirabilota bacterium]
MSDTVPPFRKAAGLRPPTGQRSAPVWAIVLAGGEGVRLRPLVRELFGDERPKQYVPLIGAVSLLRQTLNRVGRVIPSERTVVVSHQHHSRHVERELGGAPAPHTLFQPQDRGTGAAVLFAAHWIRQRERNATVVVFPSDHFVLEEGVFMAHVADVIAFVGRNPERLVLVGARPTEPDLDYGWIKPGEQLALVSAGPICRVRGFWEKPDPDKAHHCLAAGWLWNTMVFAVKAETLIEAGWEFLPTFLERLTRSTAFAGTPHEAWAIRQAYALAPTSDFSRSLLQDCPSFLAVSQLPPLTWSDLGTPARAMQVLGTLGIRSPRTVDPRTKVAALTHAENAQSA